jgi:predicted DNA-binding transcriptional regulator AlpA
MATNTSTAVRLVPFERLNPDFGIPFTRVHIYRLVRRGEFPSPVKLTGHRIAWKSNEIAEFCDSRPRVTYPPPKPTGAPAGKPGRPRTGEVNR